MLLRMEANATESTVDATRNATNDPNPFSDFKNIIIAAVLLIIIIGTIVGNILVCIAVCLVRKLRRPCNYLLVSLAVSDICVSILVMPLAMVYQIMGSWIFGEVVCNAWVSFDVLSCTASILNLCMISVDRYYAITKPLEYGVKRTPRRMIICIVVVWCGAACISLPPLLALGNEHKMNETVNNETVTVESCVVSQNFYYQVYATLCSFYIPLSVMMIVYFKIFRAARKIVLEEKRAQSHLESHCYLEISVKNGGGPPESKITNQSPSPGNPARINHRSSSASTNTICSLDKSAFGRCFASRRSNESQCPMLSGKAAAKSTTKRKSRTGLLTSMKTSPGTNTNQKKLRFQLAKERKASTTLGIIMSAFTICWFPFFVLALVRPFLNPNSETLKTVSGLFLWLGYANSLLNPIIYATLNRDFRKPFQAILYFRCGSLNHMMREEFYHSQYGDPDQHVSTRCHVDYEEGVEYIEAGGDQLKVPSEVSDAHESFL